MIVTEEQSSAALHFVANLFQAFAWGHCLEYNWMICVDLYNLFGGLAASCWLKLTLFLCLCFVQLGLETCSVDARARVQRANTGEHPVA